MLSHLLQRAEKTVLGFSSISSTLYLASSSSNSSSRRILLSGMSSPRLSTLAASSPSPDPALNATRDRFNQFQFGGDSGTGKDVCTRPVPLSWLKIRVQEQPTTWHYRYCWSSPNSLSGRRCRSWLFWSRTLETAFRVPWGNGKIKSDLHNPWLIVQSKLSFIWKISPKT